MTPYRFSCCLSLQMKYFGYHPVATTQINRQWKYNCHVSRRGSSRRLLHWLSKGNQQNQSWYPLELQNLRRNWKHKSCIGALEKMVLIKYVIIVLAIIGKKCSSFIITPPNPIYFTPPEPITLNWTFTNPYQYQVEFYEYLQGWATWDLVFKSLVWLNQNNYYVHAERLKFTTEPQCTINYAFTKREDAGRKKLRLYSYSADGSYTTQEAFTEFVIREGKLLIDNNICMHKASFGCS